MGVPPRRQTEVLFIKDVNIDTVDIVSGADGRNGLEDLSGFFPGAAGHGSVVTGGRIRGWGVCGGRDRGGV